MNEWMTWQKKEWVKNLWVIPQRRNYFSNTWRELAAHEEVWQMVARAHFLGEYETEFIFLLTFLDSNLVRIWF